MRILTALMLLMLPATAFADWTTTLRAAFPSASLVETFDTLQDWRPAGEGGAFYKWCAGSKANSSDCPRKADGSLSPWTYQSKKVATFEFEQTSGAPFAAGDVVTGVTSGKTLTVSHIWTIDGTTYMQPTVGTSLQSGGMKIGEVIQTAGGAKVGKMVNWPRVISSFGPNSWRGMGKSAQFNLGDNTSETAMSGIGIQRLGFYYGDGTATSGKKKVHLFYMTRFAPTYFGSPPYFFGSNGNVLKVVDFCSGFSSISDWGTEADRAVITSLGADQNIMTEYGYNYVVHNWKGGGSNAYTIFSSYLPRYFSVATKGTVQTAYELKSAPVAYGPTGTDGPYPRGEWFAVEIAEDIGTKDNPDGSGEVWIYNQAGQQIGNQKVTGIQRLGAFDHKYNKTTFGGNRKYGNDQSTWDERYWIDDVILSDAPIATTYFKTLRDYDSGGGDIMPPVTVATPPAGSYTTAQSVVLAPSENVTIYYTTDGSEPTTGSAVYSGPITVSVTTTIRYFAVDMWGKTETAKSSTYIIADNVGVSANLIKAAFRAPAR